MLPKQKPVGRFELSDLSNNSFLEVSKIDSSGYCSGSQSPLMKVKRNLRKSFGEKSSVLEDSNSVVSVVRKKKKIRASVIPVVSSEGKGNMENVEALSPSPIKYSACLKQSKRNLRRLLM